MITRAILTVALLLPLAARAEEMFKWHDEQGRVHYSNDGEKVPAGAQPITRQLGEIGGVPVGEAIEPPSAEPRPPTPGRPRSRFGGETSCVSNLGLLAIPQRPVDLDRRDWFDVDALCGPQHDIEGWLRRATTTLELRKIGL